MILELKEPILFKFFKYLPLTKLKNKKLKLTNHSTTSIPLINKNIYQLATKMYKLTGNNLFLLKNCVSLLEKSVYKLTSETKIQTLNPLNYYKFTNYTSTSAYSKLQYKKFIKLPLSNNLKKTLINTTGYNLDQNNYSYTNSSKGSNLVHVPSSLSTQPLFLSFRHKNNSTTVSVFSKFNNYFQTRLYLLSNNNNNLHSYQIGSKVNNLKYTTPPNILNNNYSILKLTALYKEKWHPYTNHFKTYCLPTKDSLIKINPYIQTN